MEAVKRWIERNLKAQSDIILEITPLEFKQVKGCGTVREAWKKLEEIQQIKKPMRKATLMNWLISHKMRDDDDDAQQSIQEFIDTVDKLCEIRIETNQNLLTMRLLRSLLISFENFRCVIASSGMSSRPSTRCV